MKPMDTSTNTVARSPELVAISFGPLHGSWRNTSKNPLARVAAVVVVRPKAAARTVIFVSAFRIQLPTSCMVTLASSQEPSGLSGSAGRQRIVRPPPSRLRRALGRIRLIRICRPLLRVKPFHVEGEPVCRPSNCSRSRVALRKPVPRRRHAQITACV